MEESPFSGKTAAPSKISAKARLSTAGVLHPAKVLESLTLRRFRPKNRSKIYFAPIPPRARLCATPTSEGQKCFSQRSTCPLGNWTGHAEPGFAVIPSFEQACDLGLRYEQDAIYFVSGGTLFVSLCDHRHTLKPVSRFLERVDPAS